MNFVTRVKDNASINNVVDQLNDALELLNVDSWQAYESQRLYALIDQTNNALNVINAYGISNESLKLIDCSDDIIDALNRDNPSAALEEQEVGIWKKVQAFFKELWRRISAAFRALVGKVDNNKAQEAVVVIKKADNVEEVLNSDWGNRLYIVYKLESLALLRDDIVNCIQFVKMCNELDLKSVVSKDPQEYDQFEKKFVESANQVFGATVDVSKSESGSLASFLPFCNGKSIDSDTKKFSVKFNFARERGDETRPGMAKTEFGYKTADDLAKLCRYQEEYIQFFDNITQIIERINQNIDKYMEVFEDPIRKIIPPVSLHKVRALLDRLPRACTECNKQVYEVVNTTSKMISVVVSQLAKSNIVF